MNKKILSIILIVILAISGSKQQSATADSQYCGETSCGEILCCEGFDGEIFQLPIDHRHIIEIKNIPSTSLITQNFGQIGWDNAYMAQGCEPGHEVILIPIVDTSNEVLQYMGVGYDGEEYIFLF